MKGKRFITMLAILLTTSSFAQTKLKLNKSSGTTVGQKTYLSYRAARIGALEIVAEAGTDNLDMNKASYLGEENTLRKANSYTAFKLKYNKSIGKVNASVTFQPYKLTSGIARNQADLDQQMNNLSTALSTTFLKKFSLSGSASMNTEYLGNIGGKIGYNTSFANLNVGLTSKNSLLFGRRLYYQTQAEIPLKKIYNLIANLFR